jgi:hypothetical protein
MLWHLRIHFNINKKKACTLVFFVKKHVLSKTLKFENIILLFEKITQNKFERKEKTPKQKKG